MFRMRSAMKRSLMASLLVAGVTAGLVAAIGGSPALAASKGVSCPDNTTGVTDGSFNVVCTGQTAAGATVTITQAKARSLSLTVAGTSTDTLEGASASFNGECPCSASFSVEFAPKSGLAQSVDITVTNMGKLSPEGITIHHVGLYPGGKDEGTADW